MTMHENSYYTITAGTKFRFESFGGVIYQRASDKLHFVNSRLAVTLLCMAGCGSVREVAEILSKQSPDTSQDQILAILRRWEELEIISATEFPALGANLGGSHGMELYSQAPQRADLPDLANHQPV